MFKLFPFGLSLALMLVISSCGNDNDDDGETIQLPQEEEAVDFSTRLTNNLLISGVKCNGGETTEYDGNTYTCERDEWLVRVDNVNTCDEEGRCTEIGVIPFVADLDRTDIVSPPEYIYYEIDPESPVSAEHQRILDDVWVRIDLNGDTEVINR